MKKARTKHSGAVNWKGPAGYTSNILQRAQKADPKNYKAFLATFTARQIREGIPASTLWRWEFLRRMPEYRKDYAEYVKHKTPPDPGVLLRRYGLFGCAPDPCLLCPPKLVFFDPGRDMRMPFVHYPIDIRYPVRKTLRDIEKFIRYMRRISKIRERAWPSVSTFPKLLRTLDALQAGASERVIGGIIFDSRDLKRTRAKIRQAREVQEMITAYQRLKSDK